jgi:hypothetical protein
MSIDTAKKDLLKKLKTHKVVRGAGIRGNKAGEYIVIFLEKKDPAVKQLIPKEYKGNKVVTEVVGIPRAM